MKSKKEQIMDMAFSLFLKKGYDKTSISDILSELDIARGTLYYHFESKEAIMDSIIERSTRKIMNEAKSIVLEKDLSAHEKIFALFSMTSMKGVSGGELMLDYLNQPQNALFHEKSNRTLIYQMTPILGDIIEKGVMEGSFDTSYPYESAELILVMIMGFFDVTPAISDGQVLKRRIEGLLYTIERILGANEGSFSMFKSLLIS